MIVDKVRNTIELSVLCPNAAVLVDQQQVVEVTRLQTRKYELAPCVLRLAHQKVAVVL